MAVKPVRAKVFVEEGDGVLVYLFEDEDLLHQLWSAVKYVESKTGFVTGWGWVLESPDAGDSRQMYGEKCYFSINVYKITSIEWEVEEIEDKKTEKFFF